MIRIPLDTIQTDTQLPESTDVVVIGGGIVGVSTALFLSARGVAVTLCEKGLIGAEQSSRNWGWCRTMGRDVAEIPLAIESLRLWRGMNKLIGAESGFRQRGNLWLLDGDKDRAKYHAWLDRAREYQVDARFISSAEAARLAPESARPWQEALYTSTDGTAEPFMAAPAMATAARHHGAVVLQNCAARGLDIQGGRVSGVVTEQGLIRCASVVLAGGAWSRLFCGNVGIDFPQLKILSSVMRTAPAPALPDIAAGGPDFSFRRRLDGGYTIAIRNSNVAPILIDNIKLMRDFLPTLRSSWHEFRLRLGRDFITDWRVPRRWALDRVTPFEAMRILDPEPDARDIRLGWRNTVAAFPAFARVEPVQQWAGLIDVTPDAVPVIGPVPRIPGFYLASGFSGHGFGVGPGAGQLMADLVTGAVPMVDPAPFRLSRFARTA